MGSGGGEGARRCLVAPLREEGFRKVLGTYLVLFLVRVFDFLGLHGGLHGEQEQQ